MSQRGIPARPMRKMEAGAGRGFVNPRRVNESEEEYITPAQRYEMSKDLMEAREAEATRKAYDKAMGMKRGGSVGSASKRADGCAQRGKTKGRML